MPIDKEQIKKDLIEDSNSILKDWNEPYEVDGISVMNMQGKTTFLGSLRVFDERNAPAIMREVESKLAKYGKLTVRDERIVPCCSARYTHISFNIVVDNS
ncbi:hypothetical protein [Methanobrevibacter millerae]|jgi:hypothetical protein|uniref:Uncharacterized protein n=1 Tax=Methanobrevibacter millerae TaxID=230361 RepID=A0A0U3CL32_9EURY|nr:hypothetical protein [Methanobrevibacter millerae]ALT69212.1 hypothetical protein sm9_1431 [Methanobrevibacter millerae]MBO6109791.1 hypothetical protein [Methanobrevibacter sp.]MBP3226734.1 hypothetical protein [Methanobrevibacter sp.]